MHTADVCERLMAEFGPDLPLSVVTRVALQAQRDLSCAPTGALPELIERLARQRLLALVTEQREVPRTDPEPGSPG